MYSFCVDISVVDEHVPVNPVKARSFSGVSIPGNVVVMPVWRQIHPMNVGGLPQVKMPLIPNRLKQEVGDRVMAYRLEATNLASTAILAMARRHQ
jgi:hypothetical protein